MPNSDPSRIVQSNIFGAALTFHVTHRWGKMEKNPSVDRLKEVLGQLDVVDDEHVSVALTNDSEWLLGAYPSGHAALVLPMRKLVTNFYCFPSNMNLRVPHTGRQARSSCVRRRCKPASNPV